MDKYFFKKSEKKDYELLLEFNEKTKIFHSLTKAPEKYHNDASGFCISNISGKKEYGIELKMRNQILLDNLTVSGCSQNNKPYIVNTEYIELHKVGDLLLDSIYLNLAPIFINFLLDGTTIVYNLLRLSERPKMSDTQRIASRGYEQYEITKRVLLDLNDATIFDADGKIIQKPNINYDRCRILP